MTDGAITFDFHNTLVRCDEWFRLETRDLVADFVDWQAGRRDEPVETTLLAAARGEYRALRREIVEHGEERTAEECVALVLERLGHQAPTEEIDRGVEHLMRQTLPTAEPLPGVVETLRGLGGAQIPLGIVSSAVYHPFLDWSLARFGIAACFRVVTTSASAGFYKSRPEIFERTLDALGASAERSIHVGDSIRFDVGTARRAGMRTVLVDRPDAQGDSDGHLPDLHLDSLVGAAPRILDLWRKVQDDGGDTMSMR
jgi:HAD superfamily hydrolase (TIGR01509 family)